ncbi:MAG: response regulator transcription factor [Lachnospiraceae bacterium]
MSNITVLIVDDEAPVLKAVSSVLKHEKIESVCAANSADAFTCLNQRTFDLILLDIMMPGQDGFSMLRELRKRQILTPVILLSGRGEDSAQVEGLGLGADDYMTKPFSKAVLVSKIRAIIRRTRQYAPAPAADTMPPTTAQIGCFTLHFDSQTVLKDGKEISLSSKEFALLCFFMENPDTLLTKQEIFSKVWKSETPDDNSILVYMKRLRDKIEDTPSKPVHLTTVWGKGYRFNP